MATKKYLDLSGLTQYDTKIKSVIPTKTSDLTNDSGFITDSKVVVIEYGENIKYSTVLNYLHNGYSVFCKCYIDFDMHFVNDFQYIPAVWESNDYDIITFSCMTSNEDGETVFRNIVLEYQEENGVETYGYWYDNDEHFQEKLISGLNIKTINNTSLLGSGNISISGGTATDVQINGTSIVSNDVANIVTNTAYNSSTNKIATMSDIPTFVTTDETLCSGLSLASNTYNSPTDVSITKSGYKPLGIMGYSMTGTNHQSVNVIIIDLTASNDGSGTITFRLRNLSASATATINMTAKVLWLRV